MSDRVSLADIAKETGFTKSTVSLALRDDPLVKPETRRKIKAKAKLLGYRPNPLLAALASRQFRGANRRGGTPLAYLRFPGDSEMKEIAERLIPEGKEHGRKLGYALEVYDVTDYKDGAHLSKVLFARGVQGILLPATFKADLLAGMEWKSFSVVGLGEDQPDLPALPSINRVSVDYFRLVVRAWNEAWKRGYRRIGFVLFQHTNSISDDESRFGAAEACRHRLPVRLRIPPLLVSLGKDEASKDEASKEVESWARRHRPDAVIGFNGWVLWVLREKGFRCPEDIGFIDLISEGPDQASSPDWIRLCGMKEMAWDQMRAAVELLDQQIRHHHYGLDPRARTVLIHSEWVEGGTLPRRDEANRLGATA
jgi:DNA-binding LacI/PurR family transcriptional regulator